MSTSQTFKDLHSDLRPYNPSLKMACMIKKEWNVICITTNTWKPVFTNLVRKPQGKWLNCLWLSFGYKKICWGINDIFSRNWRLFHFGSRGNLTPGMLRKYRGLPNWWSAADFFLRRRESSGSIAGSEEEWIIRLFKVIWKTTQVLYIVTRTHNLDLGTQLYKDLIHSATAKTSNPSTRPDHHATQGQWHQLW